MEWPAAIGNSAIFTGAAAAAWPAGPEPGPLAIAVESWVESESAPGNDLLSRSLSSLEAETSSRGEMGGGGGASVSSGYVGYAVKSTTTHRKYCIDHDVDHRAKKPRPVIMKEQRCLRVAAARRWVGGG